MASLPRDAKRQGERAELVFAERAMRQGWTVSKPYGESAAYDFIVDAGGVLRRVQVRSVGVERAGTYRVSGGKGGSGKTGYTAEDIDVLAAYVAPCNTWYLIPVEAFAPAKSIHLCPQRRSTRKHEKYREAWEVIGRADCGHPGKHF